MRTVKSNTNKREAKSQTGYVTAEELKKRMAVRIDKMYEGRKQVITQEDINNGISGQELIAAVCERIDRFADK